MTNKVATEAEVKKFAREIKDILQTISSEKHLDYGDGEVDVNTDADDLDTCEIVSEFVIEAPHGLSLVYIEEKIHTKPYEELIKMSKEDIKKDIWNTIKKSLREEAYDEYDEITRLAESEADRNNVFESGKSIDDFVDEQKDDLHFFEALALDLDPDQYQAALAIRNCDYYLRGSVSYNLDSDFREFVEKFKEETGIDPDDDDIISDVL